MNNLFYTAWGHLMWGRASARMDQYQVAQEHLEQSLGIFVSIEDKRMEGFTLRSLGMVANGLGDYQGWQNYSQKALSIARQIDNKVDEAEAINHLGNIAANLGNFNAANEYFHQYLDIVQQLGSKYQERMANGNLAAVASDLNDFPAAHHYYLQTLEIAQSTENLEGELVALNGLGKALSGLEQWEKATDSYQEALKLLSTFDAEWGLLGALTGLIRIAVKQGDINRALGFVDEILPYLEKGESLEYGVVGRSEGFLVCSQVLYTARDPRASKVLDQGYFELQQRADKIKDPAMRESFLENVPSNRDLLKLWSEKNNNNNRD